MAIAAAFCIAGATSASAENFGDIFAACVVGKGEKAGSIKPSTWKHCEQVAQTKKDQEKKEEESANMKLLKPGFDLHFCLIKEVDTLFKTSDPKQFDSASAAETYIYNTAIDKCMKVLTTDENHGMVYLNFKGDRQRILDFVQGLFVASRAYVFARAVEWHRK